MSVMTFRTVRTSKQSNAKPPATSRAAKSVPYGTRRKHLHNAQSQHPSVNEKNKKEEDGF